MLNIGPLELVVILVVALLVVGPKRLPEVGRSIGRGLREFRKAQEEVRQSLQFDFDEEPETTAPAAPVAPVPESAAETPEASEETGTLEASDTPVEDEDPEPPEGREPARPAPPAEAE